MPIGSSLENKRRARHQIYIVADVQVTLNVDCNFFVVHVAKKKKRKKKKMYLDI